MKLHAAGFPRATPAGVAMKLTVSLRNDNSFDVMVRNVRAHVTLANRHQLPPVVVSPQQWLPADGTTYVDVPVIVPWNQVYPLLKTTAGSPIVDYRAVGTADITATRALEVDVNNYSIDQEGAVSRAELLAAAGRGML